MKRKAKAGPPGEPVAGNGILSRRIFLEGALAAGAPAAGASAASAQPLADRAVDEDAGRGVRGLRPAVEVRKQGRAAHSAAAKSGDAGRRRGAHAAAPARRHHHAVGTAFRAQPLRHSRHRSRPAPRRHPRPGETAAGVHARGAVALSDGVAHRLHRMRRQQPGAQRAEGGAARRGRDPRPARLPGMDRREALDAARRGRRRAVGALGDRRRRRFLPP